jgi:hypothetical protein
VGTTPSRATRRFEVPITDQEDIKNLLSIKSFAITPDPRVSAAIEAAQAAVEEEAGFLFDARTGLTATLTGDGGSDVINLPQWPVTAITALTEDGSALVQGTDYVWNPSGAVRNLNGAWSSYPHDIVVTYNTGWADKNTAPQRLRWLVARVAARFWQSGVAFAQAGGSGVKQETVDGYSVTYADDLGAVTGLTHGETQAARRWRRTFRSVLTR